MEPQKNVVEVTVMSTGEIRLTADLFPEEAEHGALVRGFSADEARQLAARLIDAADTVERDGREE